MEILERKLPNKFDEQYILPILFLLLNITVVIWFYLVHEYNQPNQVFRAEYRYDLAEINLYKSTLRVQLIIYSVVLAISPLYLKYRNRWLLTAITLAHLGALYYFFWG